MAYRSRIDELTALRAKGQRPEGALVIVGDRQAEAWARKNRFFFVPVTDLGEEVVSFAGLLVIVKLAEPGRHREALQRLALTAEIVVVYGTKHRTQEVLAA